jgi:hypothetical protein
MKKRSSPTQLIIKLLASVMVAGLIGGCTKNPTTIDASGRESNPAYSKLGVVYPHPADWAQLHGEQYLKASSSCTTCHGEKLDGGASKVSCSQCHASYPHTAFWAKPENHGATFGKILDAINSKYPHANDENRKKAKEANECTVCHKAPAAGRIPDPKSAKNLSCNSCHVGVPHNEEMVTRKGESVHHMEFGNEKALEAACLSCHKPLPDNARKFMPTYKNCAFCHSDMEGPKVRVRVKWMSDEEAEKVNDFLEKLRNPPGH